MKFPKKYESRVSSAESDMDGYWIHLKPGWYSPDMECHTIHEYTVKAALAALRRTEPCTCRECREHAGKLAKLLEVANG